MGFMVTGEVDGVVTHASAKAIAVAYLDPSDIVSGFVHHGQIYGESGELWRRLMLGAGEPEDRAEARLRELLKAYIDARVERGECGPVAGWPGMDVPRECAPWDVNLDECLTCGGESHRLCGCGLECLNCGREDCDDKEL